MSLSQRLKLSYITLWALALALPLVVSCGTEGGSGHLAGTPPSSDPPMEIADGMFDVVATPSVEGCGHQDYSGSYQVTFNENGFTVNDYTGQWSATPSRVDADGETPISRVTTRGCTISTWKVIDITFTNPDSFSGSIVYRKRVAGTCDCCDACTNSYTIVGTRAP